MSKVKENELNQVVELRVFKDGSVKIKGRGFCNGKNGSMKSFVEKVKTKDEFTIISQ